MDRRYKIAVVAACPFPYPRGTPIRILRMAEGLSARGHEVHVITYHLGQKLDDLPFKIHRTPNIPTYQKVSPGPTYQKVAVLDTLLAARLFKVVASQNFDIIHAHHYEGMLASLPAMYLLRIPVVFDIHTMLEAELPYYPMGLSSRTLNWIGKIFDAWLPHRAAHIVTVTNKIRDRLINDIKVKPHHVTTIYGGIEAEHFLTKPAMKPVPATLIYTGNLAAYQGVDLMLRAFRKVLDQFPEAVLKIVTNSTLEPYSDLVSAFRLEKHLLMERADYFRLPEELHSAAIALNPRVQADGLPLKLLNYMATARAIVSFQGSAEVLTDEQTGLTVPDYDIEAFASAILRLIRNPDMAARLGANAQSHVQEFFVWESAIQSLEHIYQSLLEYNP